MLKIPLKTVLKSKVPKEISDVSIEDIVPHASLGSVYVGRTKWNNEIRFTAAELQQYFDVPAELNTPDA